MPAFPQILRPSTRLATPPRIAAFMAGLALVIVTVFGPLAAYSNTFLTVHMIQHYVLITIAPPLLLAGVPLTLRLSRPAEMVASAGSIQSSTRAGSTRSGTPWSGWRSPRYFLSGVYLTPAFQASLTKTWLHGLSYALFLFSGLHHWWPVVGGNPSHWNLAYPSERPTCSHWCRCIPC